MWGRVEQLQSRSLLTLLLLDPSELSCTEL